MYPVTCWSIWMAVQDMQDPLAWVHYQKENLLILLAVHKHTCSERTGQLLKSTFNIVSSFSQQSTSNEWMGPHFPPSASFFPILSLNHISNPYIHLTAHNFILVAFQEVKETKPFIPSSILGEKKRNPLVILRRNRFRISEWSICK